MNMLGPKNFAKFFLIISTSSTAVHSEPKYLLTFDIYISSLEIFQLTSIPTVFTSIDFKSTKNATAKKCTSNSNDDQQNPNKVHLERYFFINKLFLSLILTIQVSIHLNNKTLYVSKVKRQETVNGCNISDKILSHAQY